MAVILRYLAEIGSYADSVKVIAVRPILLLSTMKM